MRRHALLLAAAVMVGCTAEPPPRLPPPNRFYYPTGIAHVDTPDGEGALYVASANFDKCYDYGQLSAIRLKDVPGLPPLQAGTKPPATGPVALTELPVGEAQRRILQSFAGDIATWPLKSGEGVRLFIPARAEGSPLHVVNATGASLTELKCEGDAESDNCFYAAPSFDVAPAGGIDGLPRAPAPVGVAVATEGMGAGRLFMTHMEPAHLLSDNSTQPIPFTYVVELDAESPQVSLRSYHPTLSASAGTMGVALGQRYAYVTALALRASGDTLLSLIDMDPVHGLDANGNARVLSLSLGTYQATSTRGVAVSPDERRLYVAVRGSRGSDVLLVADIIGAATDAPSMRVVRTVPLAPGAQQLRVIGRPNGNLVLVTSTGESTDLTRQGAFTVYDDGLGQVVAELPNIGKQPYGLAVDMRDLADGKRAARIFVSLFGEGRVVVIDMPDVARPEATWPVAYLGAQQIESNKAGRQSATCGVGE